MKGTEVERKRSMAGAWRGRRMLLQITWDKIATKHNIREPNLLPLLCDTHTVNHRQDYISTCWEGGRGGKRGVGELYSDVYCPILNNNSSPYSRVAPTYSLLIYYYTISIIITMGRGL